jgi:DNA-binding CsgD family transcriptional regulator
MELPEFDYIARLQACPTIEAVWLECRKFAEQQGVPKVSCTYGPLRPRQAAMPPAVRGTFSRAIGKRWVRDGLFRRDPVIARVLASPAPFCWGTEFLEDQKLDEDVRAFYNALRDDGCRSMLVVPLRCDPNRGLGIGTVGNDMPRKAFEDFIARRGVLLTMAIVYTDQRWVAHARADRLAEYPLAPREAQCLELLTSGLKNEVIAKRMGITIHTVQLHLASAKRKLGAATREQALAKALTFRIIRPDRTTRPRA